MFWSDTYIRKADEDKLLIDIAGYVMILIISPVASVHLYATFHPQEASANRSKRTVDESKTSCLLHLHADHLYYKRFKSVEAVVAQVTSSSFVISKLSESWQQ